MRIIVAVFVAVVLVGCGMEASLPDDAEKAAHNAVSTLVFEKVYTDIKDTTVGLKLVKAGTITLKKSQRASVTTNEQNAGIGEMWCALYDYNVSAPEVSAYSTSGSVFVIATKHLNSWDGQVVKSDVVGTRCGW